MASTRRRIAISASRRATSRSTRRRSSPACSKAPTRFSPARDSDARRRARAAGARQHGRCRLHHRGAGAGRGREREARARAHAARTPPGSRYFADWVAEQLAELHEAQGRDIVVTTTLDPRHAGGGRSARSPRRSTATATSREVERGRARRHDARRRGARHGGRARLWRQPVQSRDPGAAPAGLGLQAVRLSRRRSSTACGRRDHFIDHRIRIGKWEPHNFENKYLRRRDRRRGAGAFAQLPSRRRCWSAPASTT